jgi:hypothetical protein
MPWSTWTTRSFQLEIAEVGQEGRTAFGFPIRGVLLLAEDLALGEQDELLLGKLESFRGAGR